MIQTFVVEYNINIKSFQEKVIINMFMYTEML